MMENLCKKKVVAEPLCKICKERTESTKHMFLLCPWTSPVWFGGCADLRIARENITSFTDWCISCFENSELNKDELISLAARAAFITWYIWKGRNDAYFNNSEPDARGTFIKAEKAWQEYKSANTVESRQLKTKEKRSEPWSSPQEGFVKINVDGAYESVSGAAAVGIVARDHHGTVLSGLGKRVRASSSEMVEVMAVREGLKLAKENEWNNVVLETDSKETFNGCTKEGCECAWEVKPLVQDIKV